MAGGRQPPTIWVMGAGTLLLPAAGLGCLWLSGLGPISLVAPRMRREAQSALAALLAAAALVCASPLVLAHLSPAVIAAVSLGSLSVVTIVRVRAVAPIVRRSIAPAAVAFVALILAAAPAVRQGTWIATSFGNADPYLWVSQAESLTSGPPPTPSAEFPDRVPYEMLIDEHGPSGLPVGLGAVASLGRLDPAQAYEAFAAIIGALLALAAFGVARGSLMWRVGLATIAGGLVAANGLLLLSTYFGWQAQLLLTAFGTLAVLTLPGALRPRETRRAMLLPALFLAAGIATYGWVFAPFLALAGVAATACWLCSPHGSVGRHAVLLRLTQVFALTVAVGLVPIVEAVWRYVVARGRFDASVLRTWSRYDWGFPSDGLGLIVRAQTVHSPGAAWTGFALVLAAVLLALGTVRTRSPRNPQGYILVASTTAVLAFLVLLAIEGASPYTSLKLMAYAAPLLTLLALSAFVPRSHPSGADAISSLRHVGAAVVLTFAALLFLITSAFTVGYAVKRVKPATEVDGVAAAAARVPAADAIRIDYADAWRQSWLVYYLRERRLAVPHPSVYLTGFSPADSIRHGSFASPASYAVAPTHRGEVVWRGADGALFRIVPAS